MQRHSHGSCVFLAAWVPLPPWASLRMLVALDNERRVAGRVVAHRSTHQPRGRLDQASLGSRCMWAAATGRGMRRGFWQRGVLCCDREWEIISTCRRQVVVAVPPLSIVVHLACRFNLSAVVLVLSLAVLV